MTFSQAQYEAVTQRVKLGVQKVGAKNQEVIPSANQAVDHWYIPSEVKEAILWMAKKLSELADWLIEKITELLEGVLAPVLFFKVGWDWEDVKGLASGVQGSIGPDALQSRTWEGTAKDDYRASIKLQPLAAGRIKDLSGSTAGALFISAAAGSAFYIAIGIIIYQFFGTLGAAVAALLSGVFSWAGFIAACADSGVTAGMIYGAIALLGACLAAQAQQMGVLHGEAVDQSLFPGGQWPKATSS